MNKPRDAIFLEKTDQVLVETHKNDDAIVDVEINGQNRKSLLNTAPNQCIETL